MSKKSKKRRHVIFDPQAIVGQRFGKLVVVKFDHDEIVKRKHGNQRLHYVLFRCDCGNEKVLEYNSVASDTESAVRSCGCLLQEKMKELRVYPNGEAYSKLYNVHYKMIRRCYDPSDKDYHKYGERGIYVCDEWSKPDRTQGYLNFYKWAMANGYVEYDSTVARKDRLSLDRIDNNGPYAPWNCRWTTYVVQANNRRISPHIEDLDGEVLTWADFDRKHHLRYRSTKTKMRKHRNKSWSLAAILYDAYNRELGIHRMPRTGEYIDKDGFPVLIPSLSHLRRSYQNGTSVYGQRHPKHP